MISGWGGHFAFCGVLVYCVDPVTQRRVEEIKLESYLAGKVGRILAVDEEILTLRNAKWRAMEGFCTKGSFSLSCSNVAVLKSWLLFRTCRFKDLGHSSNVLEVLPVKLQHGYYLRECSSSDLQYRSEGERLFKCSSVELLL